MLLDWHMYPLTVSCVIDMDVGATDELKTCMPEVAAQNEYMTSGVVGSPPWEEPPTVVPLTTVPHVRIGRGANGDGGGCRGEGGGLGGGGGRGGVGGGEGGAGGGGGAGEGGCAADAGQSTEKRKLAYWPLS